MENRDIKYTLTFEQSYAEEYLNKDNEKRYTTHYITNVDIKSTNKALMLASLRELIEELEKPIV